MTAPGQSDAGALVFVIAGEASGDMIGGRMFEDEVVLRLAHAFEQVTPWHRQRPPIG